MPAERDKTVRKEELVSVSPILTLTPVKPSPNSPHPSGSQDPAHDEKSLDTLRTIRGMLEMLLNMSNVVKEDVERVYGNHNEVAILTQQINDIFSFASREELRGR